MAVKDYGYYIKGSKIALVERDTRFENDVSSNDYGPGTNRVQWKSPLATVSGGLKVEYAYSPEYTIETTPVINKNKFFVFSVSRFLRCNNLLQQIHKLNIGSDHVH